MSRHPRLTAAEIAHALGGRRSGLSYVARCPAHDDYKPSLSLADGADSKILVYCHAGCPQAQVIGALRQRGLWPTTCAPAHRPLPTGIAPSNVDDRFAKRREFALSIWEQGVPIQGSIADAYLRSRAITTELPPALRYHPNLKHGPSGSYWPAMLGLITDGMSGQPTGLHRTFLAHDGGGKAPVNDAKMMLGIAMGGVVRLGEATDAVMVTEGIETGLSVLQATGVPTWAALSTSGLKSLNMPPGITTVTIMADGDDKGEEAALAAARRLKSVVRSVRIVRAPPDTDFNDLLRTTRKRKPQ